MAATAVHGGFNLETGAEARQFTRRGAHWCRARAGAIFRSSEPVCVAV
jgi:hypothetical protein